MMPSGHKAFLVHNTYDLDMLLMHNRTYAAEYVIFSLPSWILDSARLDLSTLEDSRRAILT